MARCPPPHPPSSQPPAAFRATLYKDIQFCPCDSPTLRTQHGDCPHSPHLCLRSQPHFASCSFLVQTASWHCTLFLLAVGPASLVPLWPPPTPGGWGMRWALLFGCVPVHSRWSRKQDAEVLPNTVLSVRSKPHAAVTKSVGAPDHDFPFSWLWLFLRLRLSYQTQCQTGGCQWTHPPYSQPLWKGFFPGDSGPSLSYGPALPFGPANSRR